MVISGGVALNSEVLCDSSKSKKTEWAQYFEKCRSVDDKNNFETLFLLKTHRKVATIT